MSAFLLLGDCREQLRTLAGNSVDSVVTDPPYGLEFMGKEWDRLGAPKGFRRADNPNDVSRSSVFGRTSRTSPEYSTGAGKTSKPGIGDRDTEWPSNRGWNEMRCAMRGHLSHGGSPCRCEHPQFVRADNRWHQIQEWHYEWAREVFRVLKPGAHLLAFGGTRTYHRMVCAIEDAGFEVRDSIHWMYGTGFPKSLNISKAVDAAAGAKREVVGTRRGKGGENLNKLSRPDGADSEQAKGCGAYGQGAKQIDIDIPVTAPATEEAKQWEGWGTALKPAHELIVLARKPLIGTVTKNVLTHGTGGLNIDACRTGDDLQGRWPANAVHDGSDDVVQSFPTAPGQQADISSTAPSEKTRGIYGPMKREREPSQSRTYADKGGTNFAMKPGARRLDEGSAARFFYCAKPTRRERGASNTHPTVKPVALMRWLCRLVAPPGGTVLDPFMGSGSTGLACQAEGFYFIGIELEVESMAIALARFGVSGPPARVIGIVPEFIPNTDDVYGRL
jgi:DNA modification methylase